ncbi:pseudouridine synthase [Sphingomonas morindae]|uniref:Pseudouridine synthase n=1 Tax=Sphingomonas morindae TaxID=1541170 RepID=A0ABY4X5H1_9SPHN|nr:pseudouridine synthase [Sphingomonas morindae]USI72178.1 pseudouridine synthase [Sphingomonas morindae]
MSASRRPPRRDRRDAPPKRTRSSGGDDGPRDGDESPRGGARAPSGERPARKGRVPRQRADGSLAVRPRDGERPSRTRAPRDATPAARDGERPARARPSGERAPSADTRPARAERAATGAARPVRARGEDARAPRAARDEAAPRPRRSQAQSGPATCRDGAAETRAPRPRGEPSRTARDAAGTPSSPARGGRPASQAHAPRRDAADPAPRARAASGRAARSAATPAAGTPRAAGAAPRGKAPRLRADGSAALRTPPPAEATAPAPARRGPPQRIAKLLARAGVASRREIERMIGEGRIALDGVPLTTPATVLPSLQGVTVDGAAVEAASPTRLFLFHKPTGLLTTERDPRGRPTIYDRLPDDLPRLMPVGRLDMNTEGLLLLTTDGEFKRQLELPRTGVPRTYRARAYGEVSQDQLEQLIEGIEIDGIRYGEIDANLERRTGRNVWIELRLAEGKNREVRRVLEHLGLQVSRLIRVGYGPFVLGDLPAGAVGEVRQHELVAFRQTLK